jgi:hypothetical protein
VDIGGHPSIPLAQKTVFHLDNFLTFFWVPNFVGCFEVLKDIFLGIWGPSDCQGHSLGSIKNRYSRLDLSNGLLCA